MNLKELFTRALKCEEGLPFPPLWEIEFHLWDAYSGRKLLVGEEFVKLTKKEKEAALQTNLEIIAEVSRSLNFAGINTPGKYWEIAPGKPAYLWMPEEYRKRQIQLLQDEMGGEILVLVSTGGILAMPEAAAFVDFSVKMFTNPEEVDEQARQLYKSAIAEVREYADIGIEAFISPSDLGDTRSPYFDPDQMDRFILPYMKDWAAFIRELGGYSIVHSDGNINMYMDAITATGINGLQAIDSLAGMDIVSLQKTYSDRLCLIGNMDIGLLNTGSPEEVYAAADELLSKCGPGKGFVFGGSNAIQVEIPLENYQAMIDAYRSFAGRDTAGPLKN